MSLLTGLADQVRRIPRLRSFGQVVAVRGAVVLAAVPHAAVGDLCLIRRRDGGTIRSQVVSFNGDQVCLAPFEEMIGISPGAAVICMGAQLAVEIGNHLIGQVVDCFAEPLVVGAGVKFCQGVRVPVQQPPPGPMNRPIIHQLLETGVAAIDSLCSLGYGQRVGLFAGAGVGKSTLLGMISRQAEVDIAVIALIGERGREVREFLDESLGAAGMSKAVAVVATSDEAPIRRALAVETATAIAEHFRGQGKRVLLLVDSLTRAARALREVGLAAGELPIRQGYTASVYMRLPKIVERAGVTTEGSITGVYTILTNGESEIDPLGEEVKSLLDGHIVLDGKLAERGVRPAIDLTQSVSRLMGRLRSERSLSNAQVVREILSRLKRDRDLLLFGGTPDAPLKAALEAEASLVAALTQRPTERRRLEDVERCLSEIVAQYRKTSAVPTA